MKSIKEVALQVLADRQDGVAFDAEAVRRDVEGAIGIWMHKKDLLSTPERVEKSLRSICRKLGFKDADTLPMEEIQRFLDERYLFGKKGMAKIVP